MKRREGGIRLIFSKNSNSRGGRRTRANQPFIKSIQSELAGRITIRYAVTGGALDNEQITVDSLTSAVVNAATASSAYRLFRAVRLRKLILYVPCQSSGASNSASIYWNSATASGSTAGRSTRHVVNALGFEPAKEVLLPPAGSTSAFWQTENTDQPLFYVSAPIGAILDVDFEYVLHDGQTPVAVVGAFSGATVGQLYYRALDVGGSGRLIPVGHLTL